MIAENPIERLAVALNAVPVPIFDTMMALMLARTVMVGTKVGVFEAVESKPCTAEEIAAACGTHPGPTEKLVAALAASGYLVRSKAGYALTRQARKWLLKDSPHSLHDNMLFRFLEWEMLERYEDYLRSGEPIELHDTAHGEDRWELYQRGMRSLSNILAAELASRTPVPARATTLLDIGGSHGYLSVCLCRRHPGLRATVLDLPDAIRHAAPLLAAEGMGDRVVHREGDALRDDLGTEAWDVVLVANLVHHFSDDVNRELARRIARALRPGGVYVIQEVVRPSSPAAAGQPGALLDLFFALTSQAGTWTYDDMADWQRCAGLVPKKPIRFRSAPGTGLQVGVKAS